jgi:hypothetical protein
MNSGTSTAPAAPKRSRLLTNSLLLHFRPTRVPGRAIRFTHTFGLGGMAMVLILLLMASGLLMGFIYDPAPERAYGSILVLQEDLLFGRLVRVDTAKRIHRSSFEPEQVVGAGVDG